MKYYVNAFSLLICPFSEQFFIYEGILLDG